ncbi:preprotein translocase subunit SecG [Hyphomicrobium sp. LHD-15]|uniref:preprotein translocase subunit SecG n=1 Tax=Hyphomicrobium sp. LHD-15 TaxID=3072142 RepID=UPI00280E4B6E|nr:preprotein translocase subunit SecG [Hyphomicrobium sp. LHD-15]MDQ8700745.1 preprotein translocase subunit SecG [Hyphomicrobium sp. LHD-15]
MTTVLLVIHLMVASALVAVVLWQRSEGGALGIGGGGGGGFLTGRGTANLLTRTTAILAAGFFLTSILLTLVSQRSAPTGSAFDRAPAASTTAPASAPAAEGTPAAPAAPADNAPRGGILDKLQ